MIVDDPAKLKYKLVFSHGEAVEALDHIRSGGKWALDFETTSLHPDSGAVRLTSVSNGVDTYLFDHNNCGSFESLASKFIGPCYIVFNSGFEYRWFDAVIPEAVELHDVGFMKAAKLGGGPRSLSRLVNDDLGIDMNKDEQTSNWSLKYLSDHQLAYAAYDAYITFKLYEHWRDELTDEQVEGFHVFNDAVRANIEMEDTGLRLDTGVHAKNVRRWELKKEVAKRYFEKYTPTSVIKNINSNKQVSDFLKRELSAEAIEVWPVTPSGKDLVLSRDVLVALVVSLPYPMNRWLIAFINYKKWAKYLGTYGDKLITIQNLTGKVKSRFNIAAAKTGRMSSSNMNAQNIPKKQYVREAFCAKPNSGDVMVLADYSGIEVRVLAEVSGDEGLKYDAIFGDVHMSAAAVINRISEDDFMAGLNDKGSKVHLKYKELRGKAKVFNFRLLYGAGVGALSISLKKPIGETEEALKAWANKYPKAYNYRHVMMDHMRQSGFLQICDGRSVYVTRQDRTLPIAANYPIQGAAASVMYRAMYHVRRLILDHGIDAVMAAVVHDEIILYAEKSCAKAAEKLLLEGMKLGWLDVFPETVTDRLADSAIGMNWGCKV